MPETGVNGLLTVIGPGHNKISAYSGDPRTWHRGYNPSNVT